MNSWVRTMCWRRDRLPIPAAGSAGKESTCDAGHLNSIPWSGISPGERKGYPLQLVAQLVRNPPAMRDLNSIPRSGRSPGEGIGYPLHYSGLENSTYSPWGRKESDMTERLSLGASNSLTFQVISVFTWCM